MASLAHGGCEGERTWANRRRGHSVVSKEEEEEGEGHEEPGRSKIIFEGQTFD